MLCVPSAGLQAETPQKTPRIEFSDVLAIAEPDPAAEDTAQIGAVVITGNEAVEDAQYQAAVEEYFGEPLTDEVLERLTDELAQLAREAGYPYARTSIDRDAAALGILQIDIDEGRIDEVAFEGKQNHAARQTLERLVGRPAQRSELESALLLVSDIPAVLLRSAKLRRIDNRNVLVVTLDERKSEARLMADNYGTESFGPIRASASARFAGLASSADQLRTNIRVNPVDLEELLFVSASYETRLSASGVTFLISGGVGNTDPGGQLDGSDINGDTRRVGVTLSAPIKRTKDASAWVEASGTYISIEQDDLGAMLRDDTLVTASIGLRTRFALAGGYGRTGAWIERGLGILGATRLGDPLASRSDGDGVFTKVRFTADARLPLVKRLDLYLAAGGQIADRPLLASEELGLGGAYRTRGYDFAEVLGDEGIYGLAELRYNFDARDLPFDFLQLYAFADGGYVSDIDQSGAEGSLFSAGPGIRARLGVFDFEVESAFPLGGSGERSASDDPEINVRAGLSF